VPADGHLGQGEVEFQFGALGPGVPGAGRVGAADELADQLHRAAQGVEPAIPVIADVHHSPTGWTATVQDIEIPVGEVRIRGPVVGHPGALRGQESSSVLEPSPDVTSGTHGFLAHWRAVEIKWIAAEGPATMQVTRSERCPAREVQAGGWRCRNSSQIETCYRAS